MRLGAFDAIGNVQYYLDLNQSRLTTSVQQLSSGLRINSAVDDPSGLAIADSLQTVVQSLSQGQTDVQTANNALLVADGALANITSILSRARSLIVEANSDSESSQQKQYIQTELNQLVLEINRISENTNFNGKNLLDGSLTSTPPQVAQPVFIANPSTGLSVSGSPPTGPPLIDSNPGTSSGGSDPNGYNLSPSTEQVYVSLTVTSYDSSSGLLTVTLTSESPDPSYGPAQTQTFQVINGTNLTPLPFPLPPMVLSPTVVDAASNPILNFTINPISQADVGKTTIIATVPTQNYIPGGAVQVNSGVSEGSTVPISIGSVSAYNLGISNLSVGDLLMNQGSEGLVDNALQTVISQRAQLGAQIVALNEQNANSSILQINLTASESSIRDLNVGQAVSQFTQQQILVQIGTSVLAQMQVGAQQLAQLMIGSLNVVTGGTAGTAGTSTGTIA